jgi:hypothetical protein
MDGQAALGTKAGAARSAETVAERSLHSRHVLSLAGQQPHPRPVGTARKPESRASTPVRPVDSAAATIPVLLNATR